MINDWDRAKAVHTQDKFNLTGRAMELYMVRTALRLLSLFQRLIFQRINPHGALSVLILFALPLIYYFPIWLHPIALGDNLVEEWQSAWFVIEHIRNGIDPLWNPYLNAGFPMAAYPNTGMYSVLNLPNLLIPGIPILRLRLMLVHGLCGIGLYLFARRLGATEKGALIGGAAFSFCGFVTGNFQALFFVSGVVGVGFVLWMMDKARTEKSPARIVTYMLIGSLLLAAQLLAGHPQLTVISGVLYGLYTFSFLRNKGRWNLNLGRAVIGIAVLGVGISAAMWLPAIRLLGRSYRSSISFEEFVKYSVNPLDLFPSIFMLNSTKNLVFYFWVGIPVALLAWRGLRDGWRDRMTKFLLGGALIAIIMSIGKYTPLSKLAFHVPILNGMIEPVRYSMAFCFVISVLAALGWDTLSKKPVGLLRTRSEIAAFTILILCFIALICSKNIGASPRLIPDLVAGAAAVIVAWRIGTKRMSNGLAVPVFIMLIMFPSWVARNSISWIFPGQDPLPEWAPHWDAIDRTIQGNPPARIVDFMDLKQKLPPQVIRSIPAHNLNIHNEWSSATGYQPMMLKRYSDLMQMEFTGAIRNKRELLSPHSRVLDLLNVKCLIVPTMFLKTPESHFRNITNKKTFMGTQFGERVNIKVAAHEKFGFRPPEFLGQVNGLATLSCLYNAADIPQGEDVAEIALIGDNNDQRVLKMRAGIETADSRKVDVPPNHDVEGITFFRPVDVPIWAGAQHGFTFQERTVKSIALLTYLFNAEAAPRNADVAAIVIVGTDGSTREFRLRAGVETTQWDADSRSDSVVRKADSFDVEGVIGNNYLAVIEVTPPIRASSIYIKCLLDRKDSGIFISHITMQRMSGMFSSLEHLGIAHDKPPSMPASGELKGNVYFAQFKFAPISPKWIEIRSLGKGSPLTSALIKSLTFLKENGQNWPVHPVDVALGNPDRFKPIYRDDLAVVLENRTALPRAWLANEILVLHPDSILPALQKGILPDGREFDPKTTALIELPLPPTPIVNPQATPREKIARFNEYSSNRIRIHVETPRQAMLVVSEKFYPGWETTVDNEPAETLRVDYVLRGIYLQPGSHEVVMEFRPPFVHWGRRISLVTLSLVFVGLVISTSIGWCRSKR